MYYLRGIGKLLQLLHIDNEEVQRVAAGALRNVVYQNSENKMEVKENDGIALILSALKSSRDVETRRQLTGLCSLTRFCVSRGFDKQYTIVFFLSLRSFVEPLFP